MASKSPPQRSGAVATSTGYTGDQFEQTVDQVQELAQVEYDRLLANIRRNPLQAAGIAAGIGFVVALLARR